MVCSWRGRVSLQSGSGLRRSGAAGTLYRRVRVCGARKRRRFRAKWLPTCSNGILFYGFQCHTSACDEKPLVVAGERIRRVDGHIAVAAEQSSILGAEEECPLLLQIQHSSFLETPQNGALQTLMLRVTKPHPQPFQCKIPNMSFNNLSLTITPLNTIFLTHITSPTLYGALLRCFVLQTLAALSNTKVSTCLAIPLIISLYNHISHYRPAYIHPSIIVKEEGFACMHACLLAQGVKRMSFLLRHVNNKCVSTEVKILSQPQHNATPWFKPTRTTTITAFNSHRQFLVNEAGIPFMPVLIHLPTCSALLCAIITLLRSNLCSVRRFLMLKSPGVRNLNSK